MNNEDLIERITINPQVMVGKPVILSTRLTAPPWRRSWGYSGLVKDDVYACLLFASKTLQDASFIPIAAEAV